MNGEELRYKAEANALAVCLSVVGLATAARVVLALVFRRIDRATTLGGPRG